MAQGKADQEALARLKKAKEHSPSDKEYSYVLSLMQAILGMPDDAQVGLAQAVAGEDSTLLPAIAWAVHGKICESYGFTTCAKVSLEKARAAAETRRDEESAEWLLAVLAK